MTTVTRSARHSTGQPRTISALPGPKRTRAAARTDATISRPSTTTSDRLRQVTPEMRARMDRSGTLGRLDGVRVVAGPGFVVGVRFGVVQDHAQDALAAELFDGLLHGRVRRLAGADDEQRAVDHRADDAGVGEQADRRRVENH